MKFLLALTLILSALFTNLETWSQPVNRVCAISVPSDVADWQELLSTPAWNCRLALANVTQITQAHVDLMPAHMKLVPNWRVDLFNPDATATANCIPYNRDNSEPEVLDPDFIQNIYSRAHNGKMFLLDPEKVALFMPHDEINNGCVSQEDLETIMQGLQNEGLNVPFILSYEIGTSGGDLPSTFPQGPYCIHAYNNKEQVLTQQAWDEFQILSEIGVPVFMGLHASQLPWYEYPGTKEAIEGVIADRWNLCLNYPSCPGVMTWGEAWAGQYGVTGLEAGVDFGLHVPVEWEPPFYENGPVPTPAPTPVPTPPPFSPGTLAISPGTAGTTNTISITGATPNSTTKVLWGYNPGNTPDCNGSENIEILNPRDNLSEISIDSQGSGSINVDIGSSLTGVTILLQGLSKNAQDCKTTNLVQEVL